MTRKRFRIFVLLLFLFGAGVGYRVSLVVVLRTYKLLNVAGLVYAFLGVLVLSEIIATAKWKAFCVQTLSPAILWIQSIVPSGAVAGGFVAAALRKPSGASVATFSLSFWAYSLLILSAFESIVVLPRLPFLSKDIETRWRWLGFFLVLSGVGCQLITGVMEVFDQP